MTKFCVKCNKDVLTFQQNTSTLPQDEQNEVRHYRETFCAFCGTCIEKNVVDTKNDQETIFPTQ